MGRTIKEILIDVFMELNTAVETENRVRLESGAPKITKSKIEILGQTSLLAQPELTHNLSLAQTGDVDALLKTDHFVKQYLKTILPRYGLIYDEDSPLIFIPKRSRFLPFLDLKNLQVTVIDPESALVSKAVKAPAKNRQLIRQAIASEEYTNLVSRIVEAGGRLEDFT